MELIDKFIDTFAGVKSISQSRNFNFERHMCPVTSESVKIEFNLIAIEENKAEEWVKAARFGVCPHCGALYYLPEEGKRLKIK